MSQPDYQIPPTQERLHEILLKIVTYQHSLSEGRAVELDELRREGILSAADDEFLTSNSVTYKPHRVSDYHAGDMLHMPTEEGGCVFIGPGGPPLTKRSASLSAFKPIVESFLKLPRPYDELLLHIEFTEQDGMGVAPEMLCFTMRGADWRERLPAIRRAAAESGLHPNQDEEIQSSHMISFGVNFDAGRTATAVIELLNRGCGFSNETEVIYSAGALDQA
jgi:hypothetical protein